MVHNINQLIPPEKQKELVESFAYATGFGLVFVDGKGRHLGPGSNFCDFCEKINESEEGRKMCELSNRNALEISMKTNRPCIYLCHAGLINIEIPLIYQNQYLGGLTAGQIRCLENNSYPCYYDSQKTPTASSLYQKYQDQYQQIKVLTIQEIEATAKALENLTDYILQLNINRVISEDLTRERERTYAIEKEKILVQKKLTEIKYNNLQKQIMPHFIFNTLNAISRMISLQLYDEANETLLTFSQLLRYVFQHKEKYTSIGKEMSFVKNYLDLQKIRFAEKFTYTFSYDQEAAPLKIPYISLQPLVENCLQHGLKDIDYPGKLSIIVKKRGDTNYIIVEDNGTGIDQATLEAIHLNLNTNQQLTNKVGIYNSLTRFKLLYGDNFSYQIESYPGKGTSIILKLKNTST